MKITILLCALVTIAAAVPTNLQGNNHQREAEDKFSDTTLREKKSPHHEQHATEPETELTSKPGNKPSAMEARHHGFKKPIIVKKKIGYHVYRDSDEEMAHADPHENCRKQVKVKLCDEEPGSPKSIESCFTSERLNEDISEKEIENSIKTAKNAVENLQRGLHKMEHHSAKLASTEDMELLQEDLAVHQHIEAARKALEHVQQSFEHHDTLHSQSSPKIEDFHSKSSDEDRLAQWKEAMDNIQKNFEIAKNIEDAFKTESELTNLQSTLLDEPAKMRESEHMESNVGTEHRTQDELLSDESDGLEKQREHSDIDMFTAPTEQKELEIKLHSDSLRTEMVTEELNSQETKTKNIATSIDHAAKMKSSDITSITDDSLKTEGVKLEKHQELNDNVHKQQFKADNNEINSEKENSQTLESNTNNKDLKLEKSSLSDSEDVTSLSKGKSIEDHLNLAESANIEIVDKTEKHQDKSVDSSDVITHQSHSEMKHSLNNEDNKAIQKEDAVVEKITLSDESPFDQSLKLKSVHENNEGGEIMNKGLSEGFMSSADKKNIELTPMKGFNNDQHSMITHTSMRTVDDQNMENKQDETHELQNLNDHSVMRMTDDQNKLHAFLMRWAQENQQRIPDLPLAQSEDLAKLIKSAEFNNGPHFQNEHTEMRLSQDHNTEHNLSDLKNHEQDPLFTQWAPEKNQHSTMRNQPIDDQNLQNIQSHFMMRLAQERQEHDHLKSLPEFHNGHMHEFIHQNKFAAANTQDLTQFGPRMQDHLHMKYAIPSDMDSSMQPSMHISMKEAMAKPSFDEMQWNHHHHAMARYGGSSGLPIAGAGAGALGVFPNANTGNCGIPLMLSCSPSVVTGTLAKAQPHPGTITAPAYRSGDELMYYMKRDAKDTEKLPTIKIQKTSIPFAHKSELIFEKSQ